MVLKQLNHEFGGIWTPGPMRVVANKSFALECIWYEKIRDRLPCPQPKLYWQGFELPEDLENDLGHFGVMMEWLGDDLKKVEVANGCTAEEVKEATEAIAKIHALFWNNAELLAKDYLFEPPEMITFFHGLGITNEEQTGPFFKILEESCIKEGTALGPKMLPYCQAAVKNIDQWLFKSKTTGNQTICTVDFRTENAIWRNNPKSASGYECVVIDHQIWCKTSAPMRDIACFLGASCTVESMPAMADLALKTYHETLLAHGVTTYSYADMEADFDLAVWIIPNWMCAASGIVGGIKAGIDAAETDEERTKGETMLTNIMKLIVTFSSRAEALMNLRNAFENPPFDAPNV
jgi:hypothetical protein